MGQSVWRYKFKIRDHAMVVTGLVSLATVFACLGQMHWLFELFACFPVHYSAILGLCLAVFIFVKKWRWVLFTSIILAVNFYSLIPLYIPRNDVTSGDYQLRLMLMNVLSSNGHYKELEDYVFEVNPEVLLMEEINSAWMSNMVEFRKRYPYSKGIAREDNFGILLFSKYPIKNVDEKYFVKGGVPSIVCDIDVHGKQVHFVGTHPLPPIGREYSLDRNLQVGRIAEHCATIKDRPVILLGDLNMPHWSHYYKQLEKVSGLRNSAYGFGLQFSWPAFGVLRFLSVPIDHCLVSDDIVVTDRFIGRFVGSDHFPIVVDVKF